MATSDEHSAIAVYNAYFSRTNYTEAFTATLSSMRAKVNFGQVKACLVLGAGDFLYEIDFIKKFAANIAELTAIEPDTDAIEELRVRLSKWLPRVRCDVVETDIQSYKGPVDPVDLVMLFHVLYSVSADDRKAIFRELHNHWVASGGCVVVLSARDTESPINENLIYKRLGSAIVAWEDIEADMLAAGFVKEHAFEMMDDVDFADPDELLRQFIQNCVERPFSLDELRDAVQEVFPDGKAESYYWLGVFRKQ